MKYIKNTLSIINFFILLTIRAYSHPDLSTVLYNHLNNELHDAHIAQKLSTMLLENILTWKTPVVEPEKIHTIVAFAFGNRILPNGNRSPGPVNHALADLVIQLHQETNAHVYAQWEIADIIGNRISNTQMTLIYPTLDAQANVIYLSTAGVIAEIIKQVCNPERLGTVAIVAFNDHIHRCIALAHAACIDAYAPRGYLMPDAYDQSSGQPWTRDRFTYLITDMKARITNYLENKIN